MESREIQPHINASPFRKNPDGTYEGERHTQIRWEKTMTFLDDQPSADRGLDIGDRTMLTTQLESFFSCPFDSTSVDLDIDPLAGHYDIVTSFEIIEHLFNPLHNLLQIRQVMTPDGKLYLSTPAGKPRFLRSPSHFHEMSHRSLKALFDRAGLTIRRQQKITIFPWWFYLTGIRPLLRVVFDRTWLFELAAEN